MVNLGFLSSTDSRGTSFERAAGAPTSRTRSGAGAACGKVRCPSALAWLRNRPRTPPRNAAVFALLRNPAVVALLGLCLVVFGVFLIVTAIDNRTETLPARVSIHRDETPRLLHQRTVLFQFDDGSVDTDGTDADPFFRAVRKFGAGTAQVTRNTEDNAIYRAEFHGKSYTLSSAADDRNGGIVAVVLGLLALAYAIRTRRRPRAVPNAPVRL